ncbi:hypothetical protein JRG49_19225 [Pseudomonas fulva]|jgi:hypothetical protein|uniref:hypothetical protein n=1 Tax=Pseudomonas fulva TaxID=47880 RepID=UPI0019D16E7C|nr:hypothetical protein [Pseudomonas fulva]MBN6792141.1 hypothetical protein [Pseudomonas fulva]MBN6797109.1 hypothetical protein [Pseudomonas fulva]MBN6857770.1 hypothetical protein [Pseudomonas fulva]MBN6874659.1 hypothetical protein [Pseudomonas fulva]MBN6879080.1 hypothetical protein [Pseudomonas fulva]
MLRINVLFSLCEKKMPEKFQEVMTHLRPPSSGYAEKIDRRLSVAYPVTLDCLGLITGTRLDEVYQYENFMLRYTNEDVELIRSQCNRLEQLMRHAGMPNALVVSDEVRVLRGLTPSEERLKYYTGWFLPALGVSGQYIDLLPLYKTFGNDFADEVHQALIDFLAGIEPKTARLKIKSLLVVNRILAGSFISREELMSGFEHKLLLVIRKHWIHFHREHFTRVSEIQFYEAMRWINEFYVAYGFINALGFPLSGRVAKMLLADEIRGKKFS